MKKLLLILFFLPALLQAQVKTVKVQGGGGASGSVNIYNSDGTIDATTTGNQRTINIKDDNFIYWYGHAAISGDSTNLYHDGRQWYIETFKDAANGGYDGGYAAIYASPSGIDLNASSYKFDNGSGLDFDINVDFSIDSTDGVLFKEFGRIKKGIRYLNADTSQWVDETLVTKGWVLANIVGGSTPSLQDVMMVNNTTTQSLIMIDASISGSVTGGGGEGFGLNLDPVNGGSLKLVSPTGFEGKIYSDLFTSNRFQHMPDADGTYVLSVSGVVPDVAGNVPLDLQTLTDFGATTTNVLTVGAINSIDGGINTLYTGGGGSALGNGGVIVKAASAIPLGEIRGDNLSGSDKQYQLPDFGSGSSQVLPISVNGVYASTNGDIVLPAKYLVLTGLINQTGTSDPVITEFENTLGASYSFTRSGVGDYGLLISLPLFLVNKTWPTVSMTQQGSGINFITWQRIGDTLLQFQSASGGGTTPTDGLTDVPFEIRIYP